MVSPSRCPPWQPERPGPNRREPRRAQRSYTTRRDTIDSSITTGNNRWGFEWSRRTGTHQNREDHKRAYLRHVRDRRELGLDLITARTKEATHLFEEPGPGRFVVEDQVIPAFEGDETGVGNHRREQATFIERHRRLVAAVQHKRGHADFG